MSSVGCLVNPHRPRDRTLPPGPHPRSRRRQFYLRTSIGVGPLRVSMSHSGLGASVSAFPDSGLAPDPAAPTLASRCRGCRHPASVVLSDVSGATTLEMTEVESSPNDTSP